MQSHFHQRISQLFQQGRLQEALRLAETHLADHPQDWVGRLYYVYALNGTGQSDRAREIVGPMLEESPDDRRLLYAAAAVELNAGKAKMAERLAATLIDLDPEDDNAFEIMAQAKLNQRNYDAALDNARQALTLNPDNATARNLFVHVSGILGKADTHDAIQDALNRNPEDPTTIANHGYQLLREGKVKQALERLRHALSLDPNNQLARHALLEALRARFWPYRLYFKFNEAMARLSGGATMGIIIGLWFLANFLSNLGEENPGWAWLINPIYYLLIAAFLSTWLLGPIMNFYLLANPYGRLLLDERDKTMARLTGASLGLCLLSLAGWAVVGSEFLLVLSFIFLGLCIPLGSFLRPYEKSQRRILTVFTIGLAVLALGGLASGKFVLLNVAAFGLLAYQFVINGMVARSAGRTFGD